MEKQLAEIEANNDGNVIIEQIYERFAKARSDKSPSDFKERADTIVDMFIKARTKDITY